MSLSDNLILVGSGGHSRVVIEAAALSGFNILGIIDINFKEVKENILGNEVLGNFQELKKYNFKDCKTIISIGDNELRSKYYNETKKLGFPLATIVHPNSNISSHAILGEGVFVGAGSIINTRTSIGNNTLINTGVIIDHECRIEEHCHIAPGVKIAGRVKIEKNSFIGIGSTVIDNVTIGKGCIIGAGSVVLESVGPNSKMAGVPAKEI